jgi:hypothetical protein
VQRGGGCDGVVACVRVTAPPVATAKVATASKEFATWK